MAGPNGLSLPKVMRPAAVLIAAAVLLCVVRLSRERWEFSGRGAPPVVPPTELLLWQQGRTAGAAAQPPTPAEASRSSTGAKSPGGGAESSGGGAKQPASGWRRALPDEVRQSAQWFDRPRTVEELLAAVPEGAAVWLSLSNSAFRDLAVNWAAHVYRLGKERSAAIAALDRNFVAALVAERLPCLELVHPLLERPAANLRSNVTGFRRFGAMKASLVLSFITRGRDVLLSDVDVVWIRDPEAVLRPLMEADVMSSTDCTSITADETYARGEREVGPARCAYMPGNRAGAFATTLQSHDTSTTRP